MPAGRGHALAGTAVVDRRDQDHPALGGALGVFAEPADVAAVPDRPGGEAERPWPSAGSGRAADAPGPGRAPIARRRRPPPESRARRRGRRRPGTRPAPGKRHTEARASRRASRAPADWHRRGSRRRAGHRRRAHRRPRNRLAANSVKAGDMIVGMPPPRRKRTGVETSGASRNTNLGERPLQILLGHKMVCNPGAILVESEASATSGHRVEGGGGGQPGRIPGIQLDLSTQSSPGGIMGFRISTETRGEPDASYRLHDDATGASALGPPVVRVQPVRPPPARWPARSGPSSSLPRISPSIHDAGPGMARPSSSPIPIGSRDATFTFQGRDFTLPVNNGPNSIHGFAVDAPWACRRARADANAAFIVGRYQISREHPEDAARTGPPTPSFRSATPWPAGG